MSALASYHAERVDMAPQEGQYSDNETVGLTLWPPGGRIEFSVGTPWSCGPIMFVERHDDGTVSCDYFFRGEKDGHGPWVRLEFGEWVFYDDETMISMAGSTLDEL